MLGELERKKCHTVSGVPKVKGLQRLMRGDVAWISALTRETNLIANWDFIGMTKGKVT